jgi:cytochrome c oxidase subunit II
VHRVAGNRYPAVEILALLRQRLDVVRASCFGLPSAGWGDRRLCTRRSRRSIRPPAGTAAIATLWWVMLGGALLILAGVTAAFVYSFKKRRGREVPEGYFLWGGGLVFPAVVLTALMAFALPIGQALLLPDDDDLVRVEAIGNQWWWAFVHPDAPQGPVHAAVDLHIPAGRTVEVTLTSDNVIHSFWVPRVTWKLDVVPGHANRLRLQADEPGVYEGVCAEFCGLHHAHMQFRLIAHAGDGYEAYLADAAAPARRRRSSGCGGLRGGMQRLPQRRPARAEPRPAPASAARSAPARRGAPLPGDRGPPPLAARARAPQAGQPQAQPRPHPRRRARADHRLPGIRTVNDATEPLTAVGRHRRLDAVWQNPPGWRRLGAVNHTVVGRRFIITAFVFFLVGGILAMLIRAQLAGPGRHSSSSAAPTTRSSPCTAR